MINIWVQLDFLMILLDTNKKVMNPYFCLINPFLSFQTRMFFSGEKLAGLVMRIDFIFFVPLQRYFSTFLNYFLSNFKLFDSLRKGWWYTSWKAAIISECI